MNLVRTFARITIAVAATASLALAGCGGGGVETVPVSGSISIDGQPIPSGTISFVAKDGVASPGGGVIQDGAYTANVPPGDKWVMVLGTQVVGQEPLYDTPESPMRDKIETLTPPAYNAHHLTPLEANIDGPKEGLNFELTKNVQPRG